MATELNIGVCVKPVPDANYYDKISIDPVSKTLIRAGIPSVINPMDKNAVEAALKLKEKFGGKVVAFSMAPDSAEENLREVLAMGADEAYLISDRAFAGADTLATSYTLATAIKQVGKFDAVFTGDESADGGTAHVAAQLGEWLNVPHLMHVSAFEYDGVVASVQTKQDNGLMDFEVKLPSVFGVCREINVPRLISVRGILRAKMQPIKIFRAGDLSELDPGLIGFCGSPTWPGDLKIPDTGRKAKTIEGDPEKIVDQIITEIRRAGISVGR
jgi:electron transfer flavoprotein beta subunit